MTGFFSAIVGVSAVALCVFSSVLKADNTGLDRSRLVFSGAITEPTCGVPPAEAVAMADRVAPEATYKRMACENVVGAASSASRRYVTTESRLADNESNPVLKYFAAYVSVERPGAAHPLLVTHIYE